MDNGFRKSASGASGWPFSNAMIRSDLKAEIFRSRRLEEKRFSSPPKRTCTVEGWSPKSAPAARPSLHVVHFTPSAEPDTIKRSASVLYGTVQYGSDQIILHSRLI